MRVFGHQKCTKCMKVYKIVQNRARLGKRLFFSGEALKKSRVVASIAKVYNMCESSTGDRDVSTMPLDHRANVAFPDLKRDLEYVVVETKETQPDEYAEERSEAAAAPAVSDNAVTNQDVYIYFQHYMSMVASTSPHVVTVALPHGPEAPNWNTERNGSMELLEDWLRTGLRRISASMKDEEISGINMPEIDEEKQRLCSPEDQCAEYAAHIYLSRVGGARSRAVAAAQAVYQDLQVLTIEMMTQKARNVQYETKGQIIRNFNARWEDEREEAANEFKAWLKTVERPASPKAAQQWAFDTSTLKRVEKRQAILEQVKQGKFAGEYAHEAMTLVKSGVIAMTEAEVNLKAHDAKMTARGQGIKSALLSLTRDGNEQTRRDDCCHSDSGLGGGEMFLSIIPWGSDNDVLCSAGELDGGFVDLNTSLEMRDKIKNGEATTAKTKQVPAMLMLHDEYGNVRNGLSGLFAPDMALSPPHNLMSIRDSAALLEKIHTLAMERKLEYQVMRTPVGGAENL